VKQGVLLFSLEIRCSYIRKALEEVIDSEQSVRLYGKPQCLFHYRHDELEQHAQASDNASMKQHVTFGLEYMEKSLYNELSTYNNMMTGRASVPRINFDELWMAFKPGSLVFVKGQGSDCVYRFKEDEYSHGWRSWPLELERVESNGKIFRLVEKLHHIYRFDGCKVLTDLAVYLMVYHKESDEFREQLLARGRKYFAFSSVHYRMYDGAQKSAASVHDDAQGQNVKQAMADPVKIGVEQLIKYN
jgi:hypothetical protein